MDYFKSLPDHAREHLLQLAARVTDIVPIETGVFHISTRQLDPKIEQRALLDEVATRTHKNYLYLYYIQVMNNPDLVEVERSFLNAKEKEKKQRAYPRFNRQSEFFYVGSSSLDLPQTFFRGLRDILDTALIRLTQFSLPIGQVV